MLDLPGRPEVNKDQLLGGCVRLPLIINAAELAAEIADLGPAPWGTTGGRVGVHRAAEALFLRGHAPAEGPLPIEDRPVLDRLPAVRAVLALLGAPPQRCLLARLPAGQVVARHIDRAPYFAKTLRIHVPVTTHAGVHMWCAGLSYRMAAGEVWALHNGAPHGVWNDGSGADDARTHLICDFLPAPELLALLAGGNRGLGRALREVDQRLAGLPA